MSIATEPFGQAPDDQAVALFTLTNAAGRQVKITNYGGIVVSLTARDRAGKLDDVVLGFETLAEYIAETPYFGAIVGRYGNRIGGAAFTLDSKKYSLAANDGPNSLHGGSTGFDKVVWRARAVEGDGADAIELEYLSADGEEGYPGALSVKVVYTWTDADELRIDYTAETDKRTVVNLTNHSYFNLAGAGVGNNLAHEIMIEADHFTPVNATLIPTGELRSVKDTPMDFTHPVAIGERIDADDEQLTLGGGYDHNWVLRSSDGSLALAARVHEPTTGRVLEVLTTEPGVQFYSGNFLDGHLVGKGGRTYVHRGALCLETQHFPDSPNRPEFPSTILSPGQTYRQTTVFRLSVRA